MKSTIKGILYSCAAASATLLWSGCEVEAADESTEVAGTNAIAAAMPPATNSVVSTNTTAQAPGSTNVQNITVVQQIAPSIPENLKFSPGTREVIRMAQAGLSEAVLLTYVEKSSDSFSFGADEILYLNDIGVAQTVIAAMMNKSGAGDASAVTSSATNLPPVAAAPAVAPDPAAATNVTQGNFGAAAASFPPPGTTSYPGGPQPQAQAPVEVITNYVADPNAPQPAVAQQPVVVQQPVIIEQPATTYSYFYSSLSPYGSWLYVADYGWCWQPTVAVHHSTWRPYLDGGRWIYTSAGWYWQSDYSWGWAPFHYGRWFCPPGRGWVWMPDYTWGPSWVTWRRGREYCGWAPLPPRAYCRPGVGFSYYDRDFSFSFSFGLSHEHYAFVPTRHFHHRHPHRHVVPTHQTVNIYKDSTVVNNYIVGNNNTIINEGISRDHISRASRTEIQKVNIRDVAPDQTRRIAPDRVVKDGNDLVVYRPTPPPADQAKAIETRHSRQELAKTSVTPSSSPGRTIRGTPVGDARSASPGSQPGVVRPSGTETASANPASRSSQEVTGRGGNGDLTRQSASVRSRGELTRTDNIPAVPKPAPIVTPIESPAPTTRYGTPVRGSTVTGSGLASTTPAGRPATASVPIGQVPRSETQIARSETASPSRATPPPVARQSSTAPAENRIAPRLQSDANRTPAPVTTAPASVPQPVARPRYSSEPSRSPVSTPAPSTARPITRSEVPGYTPSQTPQPRTAPAQPAEAQRGRMRADSWPGSTAAPAPAAPAPTVRRYDSSAPQTRQYAAPQAAPSPRVVPRSEGFVRNPTSVQSAPPPVAQPQVITPAPRARYSSEPSRSPAPAPAPSRSERQFESRPQPSAPQPRYESRRESSGPAPAASPQPSRGRGRVSIDGN